MILNISFPLAFSHIYFISVFFLSFHIRLHVYLILFRFLYLFLPFFYTLGSPLKFQSDQYLKEKLNFLGERFFSTRITNAYKIDQITHRNGPKVLFIHTFFLSFFLSGSDRHFCPGPLSIALCLHLGRLYLLRILYVSVIRKKAWFCHWFHLT